MLDSGGRLYVVPWKVADVAFATALVFVGFLAILFSLRLAIGVTGTEERTLLTPLVAGALEGLMLVSAWAFGIRKYRAPWHSVGLRRPRARWSAILPWAALLGSLAFAGIYSVTVSAMGLGSLLPQPLPEDVLGHGLSKLLNSMVIVMWGPFAGEIIFRGFLLAALVPALGPVRAAAVSSAIFAGAHLTLSAMIPMFVTGLLLAWLYLRSRSIWPPLTTHAAQNLIAVSLLA